MKISQEVKKILWEGWEYGGKKILGSYEFISPSIIDETIKKIPGLGSYRFWVFNINNQCIKIGGPEL
jgi:hypothetical protein